MEAFVFFASQIFAGLFNEWLVGSNQQIVNIITQETDFQTFWDWTVAYYLVPYFILSEYIPAIAFAYYISIFSKTFTG
jgi:hypothetical protein